MKSAISPKILIVSATSLEIKPLLIELGEGKELPFHVTRFISGRFQIDVLITGVGMVPTAVYTSIVLTENKYDAVINVGICGCFDKKIQLGQVLNIVTDYMPEVGSEDGEHFLSLIDLNLLDQDEFPYTGGKLVNDSVFESVLIDALPVKSGVTVNTVHGNARSIAAFRRQNPTDVESMEGAAFMYACKMLKTRFIQVRSVSNYIESRNLNKWNITLAIQNLNSFLMTLLNE